jgi:hypothetical protein
MHSSCIVYINNNNLFIQFYNLMYFKSVHLHLNLPNDATLQYSFQIKPVGEVNLIKDSTFICDY